MPEIRRFYQPVDFNDALTKGGVAVPTISSTSTFTAKTLSGWTDAEHKVLAADAAIASSAALATLTGFSWTVVASGVYVFHAEGPVTMTTNGGLTMAFKYTTATLTALAIEAIQCTASAIAVAANYTTTTDQGKFIDQKATAYTYVRLSGSIFVNAAGTIGLQAAQNTSHIDTTTILKGFQARLIRTS